MYRIAILIFMVVGTSFVGIAIVAVLAISQAPTDGGTPLSEMGTTLAMVTAAALLVALPTSIVIAKMLDKKFNG